MEFIGRCPFHRPPYFYSMQHGILISNTCALQAVRILQRVNNVHKVPTEATRVSKKYIYIHYVK